MSFSHELNLLLLDMIAFMTWIGIVWLHIE